jgi:hypothetical protein
MRAHPIPIPTAAPVETFTGGCGVVSPVEQFPVPVGTGCDSVVVRLEDIEFAVVAAVADMPEVEGEEPLSVMLRLNLSRKKNKTR